MVKRGRPIVETLTPAQQRMLKAVESHIATQGGSPTVRELSDELGVGVASVQKSLQRLERNGYIARVAGKSRSLRVLRSSDEPRIVGMVAIPILGVVAAGTPLFAPENQLGELLVDGTTLGSGRHFALNVSGDSMVEAGIDSGDVLIVRQQPLAEHRDVVVALLNNEATVKRLFHRDGQVKLLPENRRYKPIEVGSEDELRIVGKVVGIRKTSVSR